MQEFSSVTASSYDAESLAPMLTEKASEGWSVVSIVSAGTNVVAYLSRGGDSPADADAAARSGDEAASVDDWSADSATESDTGDAGAIAPDATAIAPSLPSEDVPAVDEPAVSSPEAVAAVEASGEPTGWGAVADTSGVADTPTVPDAPSIPETPTTPDDSSGAGGVGTAASDTVQTGADSASDVLGGATDAAPGATDQVGDAAGAAGTGLTGSISDTTTATADVAAGATDTASQTADAAPEATADAAAGADASGVPAGWYADPSGRFELRYWDGSAWTEHVSRAGQQYTDPPVA